MIGERISLEGGKQGRYLCNEHFPLQHYLRGIILTRGQDHKGNQVIVRLPVPLDDQGRLDFTKASVADRSHIAIGERGYDMWDTHLREVNL